MTGTSSSNEISSHQPGNREVVIGRHFSRLLHIYLTFILLLGYLIQGLICAKADTQQNIVLHKVGFN
jgi:flagellar biogenesis protein FliO